MASGGVEENIELLPWRRKGQILFSARRSHVNKIVKQEQRLAYININGHLEL